MTHTSWLVELDRRTRFLDRYGLGAARKAGRRALGSSLAREVTVDVDGIKLSGDIQHRSYLDGLARGRVEPFTTALLDDATRPGLHFLDVGAYLGWYALRAARKGASVTAFEPNPSTRKHLLRNVAANGARILVHPYAVADTDEVVQFFTGDGNQSSAGLAPADSNTSAVSIETRRIDELVQHADVVKIDVEGAEVRALAGMARILEAGRPLTMAVECNPDGLEAMGTSVEELLRVLRAAEMSVRVIDEAGRQLLPAETAREQAAKRDFVNLLAQR